MLNPQYAYAYSKRGAAKAELGDHLGAIEDLDQSLKLNPQNAEAYRNRGATKFDLGDLRGAIEDYQQAARLGNNETQKWLSKKGYDW